MDNLKDFEEFNKLNEDTDGHIKNLNNRIQELNLELKIYRAVTDLDQWVLGQLEQTAKNWNFDPVEAIEEVKASMDFDDVNNVIVMAIERCIRGAFYEEFEDFDWGDLYLDPEDILNEDEYEILQLDMSPDDSEEWEEATDREDLREMFTRIKIARLEEEVDWDPEDENE